MSAFGYIAFGGYLMIAPLFANGDTGFIFNALHFPIWLTIIIALAGVAFMIYTMKILSRYFVELSVIHHRLTACIHVNWNPRLAASPLGLGVDQYWLVEFENAQ